MDQISNSPTIKKLRETVLSLSPNQLSSNACWRCLDVGYRRKGGYLVACICSRRATQRAQLAIIPPIFGKPRLGRLVPRADLHPSQARAIAFVKAHRDDSFLFLGKNGTGKSHIAWCLYRYALSQRRPVVVCNLSDLIHDFRVIENGDNGRDVLKTPRLTSEDLTRSRKRYFLKIDEFEKARPSEFASEMLFGVLDTAKSFQHQLIVMSNFTSDQLGEHWGRIDPVWGNSIMTRLQDCHTIKFF